MCVFEAVVMRYDKSDWIKNISYFQDFSEQGCALQEDASEISLNLRCRLEGHPDMHTTATINCSLAPTGALYIMMCHYQSDSKASFESSLIPTPQCLPENFTIYIDIGLNDLCKYKQALMLKFSDNFKTKIDRKVPCKYIQDLLLKFPQSVTISIQA